MSSLDRAGSAIGGAVSGAASGFASAASSVGNKVNSYETTTVLKILRFLNLLNAVGLVATGVVNLVFIGNCSGTECVPVGVLAIQLALFGVLLFLYEARMGARYDNFFRSQFGFLYGQYGRLFFILFLASLCFGILYTSLPYWWVQTFVGAFSIANSWLNCFIIRNHPGFSKAQSDDLADAGIQDNAAYSQAQPVGSGVGLYGQPVPQSNGGGGGNPFTVV